MSLSATQKKSLSYATGVAVVAGVYFLWSFFNIVVVAIIMALLFTPLYRRLGKKLSSPSAAGVTLIVSLLAVIVPVIIVFALATVQIKNLSSNVTEYVSTVDFGRLGDRVVASTNDVLDSIPFVETTVSQESITSTIKTGASKFGTAFLGFMSSAVGSVTGFITASIMYIFVFLSLLRHGEELLGMGKKLNPLGEDISDMYISRAAAMIHGTVNGQFVIALVQGFLGAITFALVGFPQFFFILFLVFSALSVIPLGAGILAMPLAVVMILFGNVWQGIVILLEHLIVNTNVDNILRPILVSKEARLDPALMLLSVFAGIRFFGFLGIVIGPTFMILVVTTISLYLEVHKKPKATQP